MRLENQSEVDTHAAKMQTEEAKQIYKQRPLSATTPSSVAVAMVAAKAASCRNAASKRAGPTMSGNALTTPPMPCPHTRAAVVDAATRHAATAATPSTSMPLIYPARLSRSSAGFETSSVVLLVTTRLAS